MAEKILQLKREKISYTDKNGVSRDFYSYYVDVNGFKIAVKTLDNTGRQILESAFNQIQLHD